MAAEDKERTSEDHGRSYHRPPLLPTLNPAAEKSPLSKPALHPSVYVMYAILASVPIWIATTDARCFGQYVDRVELERHSIQQMDPGYR